MATVVDKASALEGARQILKTFEWVGTFKDILEQAAIAEQELAALAKRLDVERAKVPKATAEFLSVVDEYRLKKEDLQKGFADLRARAEAEQKNFEESIVVRKQKLQEELDALDKQIKPMTAQRNILAQQVKSEQEQAKSEHEKWMGAFAKEKSQAESELAEIKRELRGFHERVSGLAAGAN